ncbi:hypothetical protein F5879DRAFT_119747 [Lentinula edodes]|nr:hypothetical protein F5879DRAFT_119747 [Lentinula edodes]
MHRNWLHDIMRNLFIILGCVSVVLTAALPPVPEHPSPTLESHTKVVVTLHGKTPTDETVTLAIKIEIQTLLWSAARKIHGTPDLTIDAIEWDGKPQGSTETPNRISFLATVSGLRQEDSGVYTGFYFYSGVLPVPKKVNPGKPQSKKKRPAKINNRIERILNAKVTSLQGNVLLDLEVPEDRILQTTPTLSDDEDLEPGVWMRYRSYTHIKSK